MMTIEELLGKWNKLTDKQECLQRVDVNHPLDFFVGIDVDGYKELVLLSDYEPSQMHSSKSILVEKGKRRDGRWAIQIKLKYDDNNEVFCCLCKDLMDLTYICDNEYQGMQTFISRFIKWQNLLENASDTLGYEVINGLIGELSFGELVLNRKYTFDKIIDSWLGPEGADQDFIIGDTWFEVKAIASRKLTISISSLEQLDVSNEGYLAVINVDKAVKDDRKGFSLYEIFERYRKILESNSKSLFQFNEKLLNLGYYDRREYHDQFYKAGDIRIYKVNNEFPKLSRSNVHISIGNVKYDLVLSAINEWRMEENEWI